MEELARGVVCLYFAYKTGSLCLWFTKTNSKTSPIPTPALLHCLIPGGLLLVIMGISMMTHAITHHKPAFWYWIVLASLLAYCLLALAAMSLISNSRMRKMVEESHQDLEQVKQRMEAERATMSVEEYAQAQRLFAELESKVRQLDKVAGARKSWSRSGGQVTKGESPATPWYNQDNTQT